MSRNSRLRYVGTGDSKGNGRGEENVLIHLDLYALIIIQLAHLYSRGTSLASTVYKYIHKE